ncbi:T9SS C-terminal target domain-containing protein [Dysgonomonas sp. 216]|uniref:T9SS type A sorting domain-containing protein n=1 Tax=Dysgonomonas sp. 216 TaxID=2302934 RepID=UPI0013D10C28|nr:T9SS type A sorting domain-containing protein [Dysgonomonas sp. 216]NDW18994.1 T9SS C-terminal target domain-containing protein [Dysgonomonas sp. 216]
MRLKLYLAFISLLGSSLFIQGQNSLKITSWDNTEKKIELSLLDKITFSGDDLIFSYNDGSVSENFGMQTVRNITFPQSLNSIEDVTVNKTLLSVFPNPATDRIALTNLPEGSNTVSIYSIAGSLVLTVQLSYSTQAIDVSALAQGLYILKTNNEVVKFTKQ